MKHLVSFILALFAVVAVEASQVSSFSVIPESSIGHGTHSTMTFVNRSLVPAPVVGFDNVRIRNTGDMGYPDPDNVGAFRTVCDYSHMNFDDPIVYPGRPGAAHLHVYFGNTSVNAATTTANITEMGNSTCRGGIVNRSGYWAPAMIDTRNGAPMKPLFSHVYYKTGYQGVANSQVRPMPKGLRMIAGDASNTVVKPRWETNVSYGCDGGGSDTIPTCQPGQILEMHIDFPQCWNGVNLDSANHRSHMAYGRWAPVAGSPGSGCPASHPVPIPSISFIILYPVTGNDTSTWRLSSDINGSVAGTSGHADWMDGWRGQTPGEYLPNVFVARLLNQGLSGGSHMIGDGRIME